MPVYDALMSIEIEAHDFIYIALEDAEDMLKQQPGYTRSQARTMLTVQKWMLYLIQLHPELIAFDPLDWLQLKDFKTNACMLYDCTGDPFLAEGNWISKKHEPGEVSKSVLAWDKTHKQSKDDWSILKSELEWDNFQQK